MKLHLSSITLAVAGALLAIAIQRELPAELVGFDTFTVETYAPASGFSEPNWIVADLVADSGDALVAGELTNSHPTVFYNDSSVLDTRIKYLYEPGGDDDLTGFALGFNPGETTNGGAGFL